MGKNWSTRWRTKGKSSAVHLTLFPAYMYSQNLSWMYSKLNTNPFLPFILSRRYVNLSCSNYNSKNNFLPFLCLPFYIQTPTHQFYLLNIYCISHVSVSSGSTIGHDTIFFLLCYYDNMKIISPYIFQTIFCSISRDILKYNCVILLLKILQGFPIGLLITTCPRLFTSFCFAHYIPATSDSFYSVCRLNSLFPQILCICYSFCLKLSPTHQFLPD